MSRSVLRTFKTATMVLAATVLSGCGPEVLGGSDPGEAWEEDLSASSRPCGTEMPPDDEQSVLDDEALAMKPANGSTRIPVAVHVIQHSDGRGRLSAQAIAAQIEKLNASYSRTPFRFDLVSVDRTVNDRWFNADLHIERTFKSALRVPGRKVLNLYTGRPMLGGEVVLGYATPPSWVEKDPVLDGVVVHWGSLPGGFTRGFKEGGIAVHEVGHWLSLWHTFDRSRGCVGRGDDVSDTPMEAKAAWGCQVGRDTCPGQPGNDPVRNFMDYSDDTCINHFTPGQASRMWTKFVRYRL